MAEFSNKQHRKKTIRRKKKAHPDESHISHLPSSTDAITLVLTMFY